MSMPSQFEHFGPINFTLKFTKGVEPTSLNDFIFKINGTIGKPAPPPNQNLLEFKMEQPTADKIKLEISSDDFKDLIPKLKLKIKGGSDIQGTQEEDFKTFEIS